MWWKFITDIIYHFDHKFITDKTYQCDECEKKTRLKTKIDDMGSTHHSIGLCLTEEGVIGPFRYFPGWVVGGWGKSTI